MTNNQLTKEWLQNRIADMESARDDIPFGFDESGNNELAAFKLALAAMDSEPVNHLTESSVLLSSFYIAYHSWLNNGANTESVFNRSTGMCASAYDFFKSIGVDSSEPLEEMHKQFVAAGLDEKLPFNDNPNQYAEESAKAECYCNSQRVAWVKSRCEEIQERTALYVSETLAEKAK